MLNFVNCHHVQKGVMSKETTRERQENMMSLTLNIQSKYPSQQEGMKLTQVESTYSVSIPNRVQIMFQNRMVYYQSYFLNIKGYHCELGVLLFQDTQIYLSSLKLICN